MNDPLPPPMPTPSYSAPLPPPAPPVYTVAPTKPTSTTAIVSLIAGILGWTLLPWLGSIVAVIAGHMARNEVRQSNGALEGDGLALTGLILGYAMIGLTVLAIIGLFVLFGGLAALVAASH